MLSMNLMLKQMNSQVFVMALHFECNTTLVVLQVELGVVAMVLVGQVHLGAINGHVLAVVLADDLNEIVMKVLDEEGATAAVVLALTSKTAVLSHDVASKRSAQTHPHALRVDLKSAWWGIGEDGGLDANWSGSVTASRRITASTLRREGARLRVGVALARVGSRLSREGALGGVALARVGSRLSREGALGGVALARVGSRLSREGALGRIALARVGSRLSREGALGGIALARVAAWLSGVGALGGIALARVAAWLRRVALA